MNYRFSGGTLCSIALTIFVSTGGLAQQSKLPSETLAFYGTNDATIENSFAIFDLNSDGKVSRVEFRLQTGDLFFVRDTNKDMYLTPDEIPNVSPKVFAEVDTNGDKKLTPYEFGEASFMKFETYDLDKDGMITLQEVRTVVAKYRR
jgi:Ca2+-binding EF-hand superfamily protein